MSVPVMFQAELRDAEEVLYPTPEAASQWAARSTMRGLATSAVMARAAERAVDATGGLRPVRWTADLSRPIPMQPSTIKVDVLRSGHRLRLLDVELRQSDSTMARARVLFLAGEGSPPEDMWTPTRRLEQPPEDLQPDTPEPRLYHSPQVGWSTRASDHHNDSRKQLWALPFTVVAGERATPFQLAAGNADLASVVTHWGAGGMAHINADVTLAMSRLPYGSEMGISAVERTSSGGIAIGSALMHDRQGAFGAVTVCALWNGENTVEPGGRDRPLAQRDAAQGPG